jgi:hypothetical protein
MDGPKGAVLAALSGIKPAAPAQRPGPSAEQPVQRQAQAAPAMQRAAAA